MTDYGSTTICVEQLILTEQNLTYSTKYHYRYAERIKGKIQEIEPVGRGATVSLKTSEPRLYSSMVVLTSTYQHSW